MMWFSASRDKLAVELLALIYFDLTAAICIGAFLRILAKDGMMWFTGLVSEWLHKTSGFDDCIISDDLVGPMLWI